MLNLCIIIKTRGFVLFPINPVLLSSCFIITIKEACARSGARVYFRKRNGKIEILAKSNKTSKDQKAVIKILRKKKYE